jgi:hypothetical protein
VPDPNDPNASANPNVIDPNAPPVRRHLTFWRDGFTVEDGPLMQYDNAEHAELLGALHSGYVLYFLLPSLICLASSLLLPSLPCLLVS